MDDQRRVQHHQQNSGLLDSSIFSVDGFNPDDWIRKICEDSRDTSQEFLSSVLSKLQSHIQQINVSLEEDSNDAMISIPKIMRDTQMLQKEAGSLKDRMKFIKQELDKLEIGKDCPLTVLEELDKTKEALIEQTESLKEADNWSTLANDVEEVFELGDVNNISEKLFSMQKSLSVLSNASDYEDKKMQLEGLKNRLEAMASPLLVQAFTAGNVEQSMVYVDMFSKMDRLNQLLKYYHNCLKVSLAQDWRKMIEFSQEENVTHWLRTYFDKLLSIWEVQEKWFKVVFNVPSCEALLEIYGDLLRSLDPGIPECIESALKQQNNSVKLFVLIELKDCTKEFANNLKGLMDSSSKITDEKVMAFAQALYSPFIPYISKYNIYESSNLNQQLNSLEVPNEDLSDSISTLSISVAKIMDYINDANNRCKEFTEGCAYPEFVRAVNTIFGNYLEKFKVGMRQLNKRKVKHEDWNLFQMCLTLMQTIGELLTLVEDFEKHLISDIVATNTKLQNSNESPFYRFKAIFLTSTQQTQFQKFVTSVEKNEKSILEATHKSISKLCSDLHRSTYDVIFAPIFTQLLLIRKAPAWSTDKNKMPSDLPDFSFAPQEYITQVGQYLMTLPQHLEPFLLRDNPSLTKALKAADQQYSQESCESGFTNVLLGIIAKETCQMFQDQTWGIYELNQAACKQLATDIDYLGNILDELGLSLSENLQQMSQLLRLAPEEYQTGSSGCNAKVVAAVRQMRNITLSG